MRFFLFYFNFILINLFYREKANVQAGGAEGEGESQDDSPWSMEPDAGLDPTALRSLLELKSRAGRSTV